MPPALMVAIRNRLMGGGAMAQPGAVQSPAGGAPTPMQLALFKRARAKKMGGVGMGIKPPTMGV